MKKFSAFLDTNQLMNPNQHVFRAHMSCLSQLLSHYELIITAVKSKCYANVIYLDFAKASHGILLKKMKVSGGLAVWIHNFFSDRKKLVAAVITCVSQSLVMGPILFLILISDIIKNTHNSSIPSFSDDTRVLKQMSSTEDCNLL